MADEKEKIEVARRPWDLGQHWKEIQTYFKTLTETGWFGFNPVITNLVKYFWKEGEEKVTGEINALWEDTLSAFVDKGWLARDVADEIRKLKGLEAPLNYIILGSILVSLLTNYVSTTAAYSTAGLRQNLASRYSPEIPSPRDLLTAAFIAPEKTGEVRDAMKKSGYSDQNIDLFFLAAYKLYDENMVRELYLRKVLDKDQMFMRMRELGYTDTRTKEMVESWSLIPGPSDLFHLVAKEAFEPEMVEKMGLEDEYPEEQTAWLEKQGLSKYWAMKYWAAHWEMPSIQMGFEMLHRGVIGRDELDMLFKTVEVPPYWRDKLTQIAFMPFTRVDARRMHNLGVLKDEELVKVYMDQGYDQWHAEKMADFTIKYNLETQKELTKSEILKSYKERIMSKSDAKEMLMDIDYPEPQAEYLLLFEDYKQEQEYRDDQINNIADRYQNRLIDKTDAVRQLDNLNLPATERNLLIDKWELKLFKARKLPSKTDLDKFLTKKIIDIDTYRVEMDKLGYSFKQVQWYEALVAKR